MSLTGAGKIAGVVGWPITHSVSPLLHGYWLRQYNLNGAMVPLAVQPEDFSSVLSSLRKAGFRGVNVTIPHKQAAFALADDCDEAAKAAGAANLLLLHDSGRIEARNTDGVGLRESLKESLRQSLGEDYMQGKSATLLGAGGAARGAVLALAGLGVSRITIFNRHQERAQAMARELGSLVACELIAADNWPHAAAETALLINATSAGMKGRDPLDLDLAPLPKQAVVCDIVYNPLETDLLRRARARGHLCLDGLGMLMHQAAPSFEAFFGVKPEVTQGLRDYLEEALYRA
jgi:shikimate dehydrogenase